MTSPQSVTIQTTLVFCLRGGLWLLCRRFLLQSLQQDIQGISADSTTNSGSSYVNIPKIAVEPPTPTTQCSILNDEMESIPAPSTAPLKLERGGFLIWSRTSPSSLARASFALCFAESCTLFAMLIAQTAGIMSSEARLLNWQISLLLLLCMNLAAIPLLFTHCITTQVGSHYISTRPPSKRTISAKILVACLPVGSYLFLLSFVPLPSEVSVFDPVESVLARLTVLGTAFLGSLSGFGAVSNAWPFLPSRFRHADKNPSETDVAAAERSLARIQQGLAQKRAELGKDAAQSSTSTSTWFSRVLPSLRTDTATAQELRGLEALEADMSKNTAALRQRHALAAVASTPMGRLQTLSGQFLGIYCVFRLANALLNVIYPRPSRQTGSPDLLSGVFARFLAHAPVEALREADAGALARQLGLALVGWILLGSIRSLLRGGSRVLRFARRAPQAALLLLVAAQLMVTYVLSTLVQLRSSFVLVSPKDTQGNHNLLETLPPCDVFGALFDRTFIAGAIGGIALRWVDERVNG